jgi:hypothetical protein
MVPTNHQLDNAYVSGLSDELNFPGNELVHLQTITLARSSPRTTAIRVVLSKSPHEISRPSPRQPLGASTLLRQRASGYSEMMVYGFLRAQFR